MQIPDGALYLRQWGTTWVAVPPLAPPPSASVPSQITSQIDSAFYWVHPPPFSKVWGLGKNWVNFSWTTLEDLERVARNVESSGPRENRAEGGPGKMGFQGPLWYCGDAAGKTSKDCVPYGVVMTPGGPGWCKISSWLSLKARVKCPPAASPSYYVDSSQQSHIPGQGEAQKIYWSKQVRPFPNWPESPLRRLPSSRLDSVDCAVCFLFLLLAVRLGADLCHLLAWSFGEFFSGKEMGKPYEVRGSWPTTTPSSRNDPTQQVVGVGSLSCPPAPTSEVSTYNLTNCTPKGKEEDFSALGSSNVDLGEGQNILVRSPPVATKCSHGTQWEVQDGVEEEHSQKYLMLDVEVVEHTGDIFVDLSERPFGTPPLSTVTAVGQSVSCRVGAFCGVLPLGLSVTHTRKNVLSCPPPGCFRESPAEKMDDGVGVHDTDLSGRVVFSCSPREGRETNPVPKAVSKPSRPLEVVVDRARDMVAEGVSSSFHEGGDILLATKCERVQEARAEKIRLDFQRQRLSNSQKRSCQKMFLKKTVPVAYNVPELVCVNMISAEPEAYPLLSGPEPILVLPPPPGTDSLVMFDNRAVFLPPALPTSVVAVNPLDLRIVRELVRGQKEETDEEIWLNLEELRVAQEKICGTLCQWQPKFSDMSNDLAKVVHALREVCGRVQQVQDVVVQENSVGQQRLQWTSQQFELVARKMQEHFRSVAAIRNEVEQISQRVSMCEDYLRRCSPPLDLAKLTQEVQDAMSARFAYFQTQIKDCGQDSFHKNRDLFASMFEPVDRRLSHTEEGLQKLFAQVQALTSREEDSPMVVEVNAPAPTGLSLEEQERIRVLEETQALLVFQVQDIRQTMEHFASKNLVHEHFSYCEKSFSEANQEVSRLREALSGISISQKDDTPSESVEASSSTSLPQVDTSVSCHEGHTPPVLTEMGGPKTVKVKKLSSRAKVPSRFSSEAAGWDVFAAKRILVAPYQSAVVPLGVRVILPTGSRGRMVHGAGSVLREGIEGGSETFDCLWQKELFVCLFNHTNNGLVVQEGDYVAQFLVEEVPYFQLVEEEFSETDDTGRSEYSAPPPQVGKRVSKLSRFPPEEKEEPRRSRLTKYPHPPVEVLDVSRASRSEERTEPGRQAVPRDVGRQGPPREQHYTRDRGSPTSEGNTSRLSSLCDKVTLSSSSRVGEWNASRYSGPPRSLHTPISPQDFSQGDTFDSDREGSFSAFEEFNRHRSERALTRNINMVGQESYNPFALELVRQFPKFKFSGERCDFLAWQDRWEDFVQLVRQASTERVSSYVMLSLLRERVDDVTAKELALLMRRPTSTYDDIYAEICRRFGSEAGLFRNRWKKTLLQKKTNGEVVPGEWRRFKIEILDALSQNPTRDESAVREHILVQLPESWRNAVFKTEFKMRSTSRLVRVWIPEDESLDSVWDEIASEVEGLSYRDGDRKSMLVSCADQWSHKKLLQLNGLFLNGKKLRVCAAETQCTVAELCEIVDERVEQMEELKAMAGEVGCEAPVRAVAQESSSSTETRVTVKDAPSKGKGKEAGSGALPCPAGKPASSVQCLACWHFGRLDTHDYKKM